MNYIEDVTSEKIIADIYVDDRSIQFNGNVNQLEKEINTFEPWYYRE